MLINVKSGLKCTLITFQFSILVSPSLFNNYITYMQKLVINFSNRKAANIPTKSHATPPHCLPTT